MADNGDETSTAALEEAARLHALITEHKANISALIPDRDRAIRAARDAGCGRNEIVTATGLTAPHVTRICRD